MRSEGRASEQFLGGVTQRPAKPGPVTCAPPALARPVSPRTRWPTTPPAAAHRPPLLTLRCRLGRRLSCVLCFCSALLGCPSASKTPARGRCPLERLFLQRLVLRRLSCLLLFASCFALSCFLFPPPCTLAHTAWPALACRPPADIICACRLTIGCALAGAERPLASLAYTSISNTIPRSMASVLLSPRASLHIAYERSSHRQSVSVLLGSQTFRPVVALCASLFPLDVGSSPST